MEPLNKPARAKAIQRFAGFYALSLALPLLGFYFLLRSPGGSLASENEKLKREKGEYDFLLTRLDSISRQTRHLQELDSRMYSADPVQKSQLEVAAQNYERNISLLAKEDRTAQTANLDALPKAQANTVGHGFEALLGYRKQIERLNELLASKGGNDAEIAQLKQERSMNEQKISQLEIQVEILRGQIGKPGGGGGGASPQPKPVRDGGDGAKQAQAQAQIEECTKEKKALQVQLAHELELGKATMLHKILKENIGNLARKERILYKETAIKILDDLLKTPGISDDVRARANNLQTQVGAIK
jgi:hypothetical protein